MGKGSRGKRGVKSRERAKSRTLYNLELEQVSSKECLYALKSWVSFYTPAAKQENKI